MSALVEPHAAHPAAELFPLISDEELRELADDIRAHGLLEPIIRTDGLILDGRNRLRACELAGVEPQFVEWDGRGGSAVTFVLSENLRRRHLSASQRAVIANQARPMFEAEARAAQRTSGPGIYGGEPLPREIEKAVPLAETARRAADLAGVSADYVYRAARVAREAPEAIPRILAGEISVETAHKDLTGTRQARVYIKDKHAELIKRADAFARLADRWDVSMTEALAPPQARKQLTVLKKAAALLGEAIEAVEYRADIPHTFLGR